MTALVAVMNKQAVALSADSAGTVPMPGRDHHKIYAVNKVFALSKSEPVGIMICGENQFLGLPWESIIKRFRRADVARKYPSIDEWRDSLLTFLKSLIPTLTYAVRDRLAIHRYLAILDNVISTLVKKAPGDTISQDLEDLLSLRSRNIASYDVVTEMPDTLLDDFIARNQTSIESQENRILTSYGQTPFELAELRRSLLLGLLTRRFPLEGSSQFVIAGFGTDDWFPSVRSAYVDGVANEHVRFWKGAESTITNDLGADIVQFAQGDMVQTLLRGIHPKIRETLNTELMELSRRFPDHIATLLKQSLPDSAALEAVMKAIRETAAGAVATISKQLDQQSSREHTLPILSSIQHLGKVELAQLAESLITTTSLKYRMAFDAQESVGGPVDVAVVSRDEGFIWIRRKHYFDIDLNPTFRDQQARL
jgi:hypothetical protein